MTRFRFWPLTSVLWTAQLGALGVAASLVDGGWRATWRLLGQSLFTASQFGVTLEYLWRRTATPPPTTTLPRRTGR